MNSYIKAQSRFMPHKPAQPIIFSRELRMKLYMEEILKGFCLVAFLALCVAGAALVIVNN